MYLTNPTIEELIQLDLDSLVDMLVNQTSNYIHLLNTEGYSSATRGSYESVTNIQAAIEIKKKINTIRNRNSGQDPATYS